MGEGGTLGTSVLEAALALARQGIPVFPACFPVKGECGCGRGHSGRNVGKAPLTPRGFKDATTDEETIRRWWREYPFANLAVATGGEFGLVVVDVDGVDGLQSIASRHLPTTPHVFTPGNGGGTHYYYRVPNCPYSSAVRLLPGVDVRANGGYVIAPPSLHRSGRTYSWAVNPSDVPFAAPPSWLVELLRVQRERGSAKTVEDPEILQAVATAVRALLDLGEYRRDEYGHWLEVGMALSELGDIGLLLWDAWSRPSPKYEPGVCAKKWATFSPGAGVTLGSLVHWAQEDRDSRGTPETIVDIERSVLGYALRKPEALPELIRRVRADMFVGPLHREAWAAIVRLYNAGSTPTIEAVRALVGGDAEASQALEALPDKACSESALSGHIAVMEEYAGARAVQRLGYELAHIAESRRDAVARAHAAWMKFLASIPADGNEMTLDELVNEARLFAIRNDGIPSGCEPLDETAGPLEPGSLTLIYGAPGQGKTLLALALARRQGRAGIPVGFVSLEMSPGPLGLRVATAEVARPKRELVWAAQNAESDRERLWELVRERGRTLPVWFAFNIRDIDDLVRFGRRLHDLRRVQVLYIDHLQEITTRRQWESAVQAMDYIIGALKGLAMETGMAVVTLAQFNRTYLNRLKEGGVPGFESLRGSSRIEQTADRIITMVPRVRDPGGGQGIGVFARPPWEDVVLHVQKNRNGPKGTVEIRLDYTRQDIGPVPAAGPREWA